jgi:hypothetical protein
MAGESAQGFASGQGAPAYDIRVELLKNGFALALCREAHPVCKMEFFRQMLHVGDLPVEVARIGPAEEQDNCAVQFLESGDPEHFDALIKLAHNFLLENDVCAVVVHGNRFLYDRAGYVPCFYHAITSIRASDALKARKQHTVRHYRGEDSAQMDSLSRRFLRYHPRLLSHREIPDENILVAAGQRDEMLAYARVNVQGGAHESAPWGKVYVTEVGGSGPASMETLLRALAEIAREHNVPELFFPFSPFHPFSRLCLQLGGASTALGPTNDGAKEEDMVAILDLGGFIKAMCPEFERRLQQASQTEWRGSIYLRTERDLASIDVDGPDVQSGGIHDGTTMATMLSVPQKLLTQVLTGFCSFHDIREEPSVSYSIRSRETLSALFPSILPASQGDFSVFRPQFTPKLRPSEAALKLIRGGT